MDYTFTLNSLIEGTGVLAAVHPGDSLRNWISLYRGKVTM
jgi:hypothetical protein